MKKLIITILILLAGGSGGAYLDNQLGSYGGGNPFIAPDTSSGHQNIWATSSPYRVALKNPNRSYFRISIFPYSTSTVWIWQATSTDLVAVNKGIPLHASSTASFYEIDSDNPYIGEIQVIADPEARISWFEK